MAITILWSIAWLAALNGVGETTLKILRRVMNAPSPTPPATGEADFAVKGMLGLMTTGAAGTLLHFFLPLNTTVSLVFLGGGLLSAVYHRRQAGIKLTPILPVWLSSLLFSGLAIFMFCEIHLYDTGLYHLQAVRWISESPVIPGLANLHSRLGFNSSWFIINALINPPAALTGEPVPTGNILMMHLYGTVIFQSVILGLRETFTAQRIFFSLTFIPWLWLMGFQLPSLSNNAPVFILTWLLTGLIAGEMESGDSSRMGSGVIIYLAMFVLTIKLSSAGFAAGAALMAVYRGLRGLEVGERWGRNGLRMLGAIGAGIVIMLLPWMARGVVLAGGPFFPAKMLHMQQLTWAAPEVDRRHVELSVKLFARETLREAQKGDWDAPWLDKWLNRNKKALMTIFVPGAAGLLLLGLWPLLGVKPEGWGILLVPLGVTLGGVLFWFFSAPGVRFGYGFLHALALLPAMFALRQAARIPALNASVNGKKGYAGRLLLYAFPLAVIMPVLYRSRPGGWFFLGAVGTILLALRFREGGKFLETAVIVALLGNILLNPFLHAYIGEHFRLEGRLPEVIWTTRQTEQGTEIWLPSGSDQCWNGGGLCTPYFKPGLKITFAEDDAGRPVMFRLEWKRGQAFSEGANQPEGSD